MPTQPAAAHAKNCHHGMRRTLWYESSNSETYWPRVRTTAVARAEGW